jgi:hypothetical protein
VSYSLLGSWEEIPQLQSSVSVTLPSLLNDLVVVRETWFHRVFTAMCSDSDAEKIRELLEAGKTSEVESSLRPGLEAQLPDAGLVWDSSMIQLNPGKRLIVSVYARNSGTGI